MRSKIWLVIFGSYLFLAAVNWIKAEEPRLLSIENKYIKIFMNNTPDETGRFAVDVTKGDQTREDDDSKPLIYGRPIPWTSFTTIQINGINYVFGSPTKKRPGAGLPGGEIISPPGIVDQKLVMCCKYGPVIVEQSLGIVRSPSTGVQDNARIKYHFKNQGPAPVKAGLRALLDTMVGDNDAAPFRLGNQEITAEYSRGGNEVPDFWQAFDSLARPAVIAQGTLKGEDVTTPDRIVYTNWGKAADAPWDFPVEPGQVFLRQDEDELDSAVVMFWEPRELGPDEEFEIVIYYGLGGITVSPGKTFLGISAPAEVFYSATQPRNYTIMMYLEHHGEGLAKNVKINLELPKGLGLVSGSTNGSTAGGAALTLPELFPEVTKQFSWEIRPNGASWGEASFQIKVSGDNLEANQVSRKIKIIGPPVITGKVSFPVLNVIKNAWAPDPLPVSVKIKNAGESGAYNLRATLSEVSGLRLVEGETSVKLLDGLESKEETGTTWLMTPVPGFKTGKLNVIISGNGITPVSLTGELVIPQLSSQFAFAALGKAKLNRPFCLELMGYNLTDISKFRVNVKYDTQQLRLISVSRGTFAVEGKSLAPWSGGIIDYLAGRVTDINCARKSPYSGESVSLLRLNFIAIGSGEGQVKIENLTILDSKGTELSHIYFSTKYQIEGE
ncbi:MAG: cohesin domain-containing protein [Firmicutes bacterium]|nr:cohesin domain-containing protein [Bacillota bacterium]